MNAGLNARVQRLDLGGIGSCQWSDTTETSMTLIMCDLIGSTTRLTGLPAYDIATALLNFYSACSAQLEQSHGRVVRYAGDAVMAVFDDDASANERATRAVTAATSIEHRLQKDLSVTTAGPYSRTSVVTGTGLRALLGTSNELIQEVIFGELPFLANRLQGLAPPGGVVLCDRTVQLLPNSPKLETLGLVPLRGITVPRKAWIVNTETAP